MVSIAGLSGLFGTAAKVTGVAAGYGIANGYEQHRDDARDFASATELPQLRIALREAQHSLNAGHEALTAIWRAPLSLLSAHDEVCARERGVPEWAVSTAIFARGLVREASALGDVAEVYQTQILLAERDDRGAETGASSRGLLRDPVLVLVRCLDDLQQRLTAAVPGLIHAREAFDADPAALVENPRAACVLEAGLTPPQQRSEELPLEILRGRGQLGEMYSYAISLGYASGESLQRALVLRYDGPEIRACWMWGESMFGVELARLSPSHWSEVKSVEDTISDLMALSPKDMEKPVVLKVFRKDQWDGPWLPEERLPNARAALARLFEVLACDMPSTSLDQQEESRSPDDLGRLSGAIMRGRGRFGELIGSLKSASQTYESPLKKAMATSQAWGEQALAVGKTYGKPLKCAIVKQMEEKPMKKAITKLIEETRDVPEIRVSWMWGDSVIDTTLARFNLGHWSKLRNVEETLADLIAVDLDGTERPLVLKVLRREQWDGPWIPEEHMPNVRAAIVRLAEIHFELENRATFRFKRMPSVATWLQAKPYEI